MENPRTTSAFTLIELLAVIFVVGLFIVMLIPMHSDPQGRSSAVACMNNQRQIALGLIMFANDHGEQYPWQVSATNHDFLEATVPGVVSPHIRAMSSYFDNRSFVFICPTDSGKHPATNFAELRDPNVSYFLNLSATNISSFILAGDRHLAADGKPVRPGPFDYSTNVNLSWTRELHGKAQSAGQGGLAFADGHVEFKQSRSLNASFQHQPLTTNLLVVP